jgi:hypothetical protein
VSTLNQLAAQLKGWLPGMETLSCLPFVQQAYKDIRKSRKWSFLRQNGILYVPQQIITGTVATTQFNSQVVFDATATAALAVIGLTPAPPQSPLTLMQFRITGGPLYNITAWANNTPSAGLSTATLNRPYTEQSGAGLSYQVYQPYQPAPTADFDGWLSVTDYTSGYAFRRRNLFKTQNEVDRRDPYRQDFAWPIWMASLDYVAVNSVQTPRYEMWPHPVDGRAYVVEFWVRGDGVAAGDTLPVQITDELIIARGRYYGYQFLATQENVSKDRLSAILSQQRYVSAVYTDLLEAAKKDDNNVFDSRVMEAEDDLVLSGPLDADFLQGHDIFLIR